MSIALAGLVVALLIAGATTAQAQEESLKVTSKIVNTSYLEYTVECTGRRGTTRTFHSGDTFYRMGGTEWNSNKGSALLMNHGKVTGDDMLGPFVGEKYSWTMDAATPYPFVDYETEVRTYPDMPNAVVFTQSFPQGLDKTATGNPDALVTSFPSFAINKQTESSNVGYAHFAGFMAGNYPQYGEWTVNGTFDGLLYGGIKDSGMIAFYDKNKDVSLIVSPLTEFMSASLSVTLDKSGGNSSSSNETFKRQLQWGIMGNATRIPKGFQSSWIMVAHAGGVTEAVRRWGRILRKAYNKKAASPHSRDLTLQYLGYSTDNGAFYYYYKGNHAKNYQQLLGMIKNYSLEVGLPYAYTELDSWWYYRSDNADKTGVPLSGVTNWTAMPNVFPDGLPFVHKETKWAIQAHNRYWSWSNVYASNPHSPIGPTNYTGKKFEFVWGENDAGLPTSFEFWDYLFHINENWGLHVYEQDWLSLTTKSMPILTQNVTFGRQWLLQMGRGAEKHGLNIQYCMSFPRHVFTSLELKAVTQARASNDYQPQMQLFDYNQWRIAESSLWVSAIGLAPSKDSYWSMPNSQFDPHYDPILNTSETRNRLESAVSSIQNGPVQISDRIGYSNVSLIMRCCRKDGLLLRPDISAAPLDLYFVRRAFGSNAPKQTSGELHASFSSLDSYGTYFYLMTINTLQPFHLDVDDLPYVSEAAALNQKQYLVYEANTTTVVKMFGSASPLTINPSDEYSFMYLSFVPVPSAANATSQWLLQGETNKCTASRQRFERVLLDGQGGAATSVRGVPGEVVSVSFVHVQSLRTVSVECHMTESLRARATVSDNGMARCHPEDF